MLYSNAIAGVFYLLILKIIGPILVLAVVLLQSLLEHKWRDRSRVGKLILITIIASMLFTVITVYIDHRSSRDTSKQLARLQQSSDSTSLNAKKMEASAKKERANLEDKLTMLQSKLDPFVDLAIKKYPNLEPDVALQQLADEVQELRNRTEKIKKQSDYLASRETFKALNPEIRVNIIQALKTFLNNHKEKQFIINVIEERGSRPRHRLAEQIIELLRTSGFPKIKRIITDSSWRGTPPSLLFKINRSDEKTARQFISTMTPVFKELPQGRFDEQLRRGEFSIAIYGDPFFEANGRVSFKKN